MKKMSIRRLSEYQHKPRHVDYLGLILSDFDNAQSAKEVRQNLTDLYADMLTEHACVNRYRPWYYHMCQFFQKIKLRMY